MTIRYEFEVMDERDQTVASGDAPTLEQAESEGRRYLAQYQQDGPCTLELRRVEVLKVSTTPDRPPLWRVIQSCLALIPVDGLLRRRPVAVLIRAVRDWIQCHSDLTMKPSTWHQIYDLLTAEAERAEQGDEHQPQRTL
jgi:hypothetical protein